MGRPQRYPADYYDGDWARIHKGHGLSRHDLWGDLKGDGVQPADTYFKVTEEYLHEIPRVMWCERYADACELNGEWHRHWSAVKPGPEDAKFTLVRWAKLTTTGLTTLQFGREPTGDYAVHLVRSTQTGTPGPTLCGIDRFAKDGPGWSVGGGVTGPNVVHTPCVGCASEAVDKFPELSVSGSVGSKEITETIRQLRRVPALAHVGRANDVH